MLEKIKQTLGQFSRFFIVGVMNTGVDLVILNLEMFATGIKDGSIYGVQKGISFLVAVTFSYFMNKSWTFKDNTKTDEGKKFSQFFAASIVGMIINVSVATIVVTYGKPVVNNFLHLGILTDQIWGNIGALSGTTLGLIWNFVSYKFWVFKK